MNRFPEEVRAQPNKDIEAMEIIFKVRESRKPDSNIGGINN